MTPVLVRFAGVFHFLVVAALAFYAPRAANATLRVALASASAVLLALAVHAGGASTSGVSLVDPRWLWVGPCAAVALITLLRDGRARVVVGAVLLAECAVAVLVLRVVTFRAGLDGDVTAGLGSLGGVRVSAPIAWLLVGITSGSAALHFAHGPGTGARALDLRLMAALLGSVVALTASTGVLVALGWGVVGLAGSDRATSSSRWHHELLASLGLGVTLLAALTSSGSETLQSLAQVRLASTVEWVGYAMLLHACTVRLGLWPLVEPRTGPPAAETDLGARAVGGVIGPLSAVGLFLRLGHGPFGAAAWRAGPTVAWGVVLLFIVVPAFACWRISRRGTIESLGRQQWGLVLLGLVVGSSTGISAAVYGALGTGAWFLLIVVAERAARLQRNSRTVAMLGSVIVVAGLGVPLSPGFAMRVMVSSATFVAQPLGLHAAPIALVVLLALTFTVAAVAAGARGWSHPSARALASRSGDANTAGRIAAVASLVVLVGIALGCVPGVVERGMRARAEAAISDYVDARRTGFEDGGRISWADP